MVNMAPLPCSGLRWSSQLFPIECNVPRKLIAKGLYRVMFSMYLICLFIKNVEFYHLPCFIYWDDILSFILLMVTGFGDRYWTIFASLQRMSYYLGVTHVVLGTEPLHWATRALDHQGVSPSPSFYSVILGKISTMVWPPGYFADDFDFYVHQGSFLFFKGFFFLMMAFFFLMCTDLVVQYLCVPAYLSSSQKAQLSSLGLVHLLFQWNFRIESMNEWMLKPRHWNKQNTKGKCFNCLFTQCLKQWELTGWSHYFAKERWHLKKTYTGEIIDTGSKNWWLF